MDKKWIEEKSKELKKDITKRQRPIVDFINDLEIVPKPVRKEWVKKVTDFNGSNYYYDNSLKHLLMEAPFDYHFTDSLWGQEWVRAVENLDLNGYFNQVVKLNTLESRYADSEPVAFDGDIIITDPCYIIRDGERCDDWRKSDYGSHMEDLGLKTFMTRETIYGDWSCTVFDADTDEKIGEFCADAGLVSVFQLDEVLKYNPSFNEHITRPWTAALIKNFKGTVRFVIEKVSCEDGENEYFTVHVVGHGVDKTTGKPINFISRQTGF